METIKKADDDDDHYSVQIHILMDLNYYINYVVV